MEGSANVKVLVKINLESTIDKYINKCDGLILGISHFSVGFKDTFDIEEISKIIEKYPNKDIFISINKSIFNNELEELEKVLTRLNKMPIKGILFYDLSILYLKKKHNFNTTDVKFEILLLYGEVNELFQAWLKEDQENINEELADVAYFPGVNAFKVKK